MNADDGKVKLLMATHPFYLSFVFLFALPLSFFVLINELIISKFIFELFNTRIDHNNGFFFSYTLPPIVIDIDDIW